VCADVNPPTEHKPIAQLAHGLDRVLFKCVFPFLSHESPRLITSRSPGVYWLQDPRSRVYNFTPWLETIPKVNDFAFERVTGFIRSSQDNVRAIPSFLSFYCPQSLSSPSPHRISIPLLNYTLDHTLALPPPSPVCSVTFTSSSPMEKT